MVSLVFTLLFLTMNLKIENKGLRATITTWLANLMTHILQTYWTSKTALCWGKCSCCIGVPVVVFLPADKSCRSSKMCKGQNSTRNFSSHTDTSCKETVVPTPVLNCNGQHAIDWFCFMGVKIMVFFRSSQMHMKLKAGQCVVEQSEHLAVVCAICRHRHYRYCPSTTLSNHPGLSQLWLPNHFRVMVVQIDMRILYFLM